MVAAIEYNKNRKEKFTNTFSSNSTIDKNVIQSARADVFEILDKKDPKNLVNVQSKKSTKGVLLVSIKDC